jgi:hypothetical protein
VYKKGKLLGIMFSLFLGLTNISFAEGIELRGRVMDQYGRAIEGAEINADEIPYVIAVSDDVGRFALYFEEGDIDATVRIRVYKPGFKIWFEDVKISQDMEPLGSITLETPLDAPPLSEPKNDTTVYHPYPAFRWEPKEGCTYNLQADDESNFLDPEINEEDLTAAHYRSRIKLADGVYYWRVQLKTEMGNYSRWSESWIVSILDLVAIKRARKWKAAFLSLVPGAGQLYKGRPIWEWAGFMLLTGGSIYGALYFDARYDDEYQRYQDVISVWELREAYDEAKDARTTRNGFWIAAGTLWTANIVHAYLSKDVRIEREFYGQMDYGFNIQNGQVQLVFTKSF